ncbi:L-glutamate gamma-semialdehyde dehydrogenase [Marinicella litoralis]|uniref:L-glutamate gamma-semialdehyde dehydrogenase n=1 Tax=Marinicella litoralis TaxID=644220 RepID=A0A4R6XG68_9GAMM|nr:L-glutamate gamma-semialdehyde dehydrogenase [Marinicella litoralis]TDR16800.1 delta-1-pyrroline-5-carboxylate dehydrogenase [Marinicella litoralis]
MISANIPQTPAVKNEPISEFRPGSAETLSLQSTMDHMAAQQADIPCFIGGQEVRTGQVENVVMPHDHSHVLGQAHVGGHQELNQAADAAIKAQKDWAALPWQSRAAVFLKAADLLAGPYRNIINAATMHGQSKNCFQAEIDAACELIDFLRFNAYFYQQIMEQQPVSSPGVWNQLDWRPLEGFVMAITPFNFTAIAGNLPATPAMLGNVVVWKPSGTQMLSAYIIMQVFKEAGLPDGVINMVAADGPVAGAALLPRPDLAGVHFTGSTPTFQHIFAEVGGNIGRYHSYPRLVGETGGKDFVFAHESANPIAVATALARGAFEYQGQKCSAASRAYIPSAIWPEVKAQLVEDVKSFKMGSTRDFGNFINAVIDERSFDKIKSYVDFASNAADAEIVVGGVCDKSEGYFVEPTVIVTSNPQFKTMQEEIFGPVLTIYVYAEADFEDTLELCDQGSIYALTGAIFAQDRFMINHMADRLRNAAGNFYINDKPTGAVVGQQPFGGGRASGTNDKAGSALNLYRWLSPRTIKETFVTPTDYRYPFLG